MVNKGELNCLFGFVNIPQDELMFISFWVQYTVASVWNIGETGEIYSGQKV